MIVLEIHLNYFIVLPIRLKTCRFNVFTKQNVRAREIGRVLEVLCARACSIGIGRAICPGLMVQFLLRGIF